MAACQGYDIIKLISEKIQGTNSSLDFMNNVKSEDGFNGLAILKFDMYGRLDSDGGNLFYISKD